MNIKVKGYYKLDDKKNYVILDSHNVEVGTLNVLNDPITVDLNDNTIKEFKTPEDLEQWFENNNYMLTTDSVRWIEYNPNPDSNSTNDCSIRAYCAAEDITWDEAYDIATKYGKDMSLMPNDNKTCQKILSDEFGYDYYKLKKEERGKTVNQMAIDHPSGIYILDCSSHLVTIIDGEYYDSWDSGKKKVKGFYMKTPVELV